MGVDCQDLYGILQVTASASENDIRKSYLRLALQLHPDRNPGREEIVKKKFQELTHAHAVLIDQIKRKEYDRTRPVREAPAGAGRSRFASAFKAYHQAKSSTSKADERFRKAEARFQKARKPQSEKFASGHSGFSFREDTDWSDFIRRPTAQESPKPKESKIPSADGRQRFTFRFPAKKSNGSAQNASAAGYDPTNFFSKDEQSTSHYDFHAKRATKPKDDDDIVQISKHEFMQAMNSGAQGKHTRKDSPDTYIFQQRFPSMRSSVRAQHLASDAFKFCDTIPNFQPATAKPQASQQSKAASSDLFADKLAGLRFDTDKKPSAAAGRTPDQMDIDAKSGQSPFAVTVEDVEDEFPTFTAFAKAPPFGNHLDDLKDMQNACPKSDTTELASSIVSAVAELDIPQPQEDLLSSSGVSLRLRLRDFHRRSQHILGDMKKYMDLVVAKQIDLDPMTGDVDCQRLVEYMNESSLVRNAWLRLDEKRAGAIRLYYSHQHELHATVDD